MIATLLCVVALATTYWAGNRSLSWGVIVLIAYGYAYGIMRANLPSTASHFIFDAALAGLYISQPWSINNKLEAKRVSAIHAWAAALIAWPLLLALLPFQNALVTLVGLRGNVFVLPAIVLGSRLNSRHLIHIAIGIGVLNLFALGVAGAEYAVGVESFFPRSEVTSLIYMSQDVAAEGLFRIPSTFVNAHAFAGTMVMTLPFLFGAWIQSRHPVNRGLLLFGIISALLGVLMAATRLHFVAACVIVLVSTFSMRLGAGKRLLWTIGLIAIGITTANNDRLQRFTSLGDAAVVSDRVYGSVNSGFWDILRGHPLGNGLGGGGTSMPYFLQDQIRDLVIMENEYARILAEQGIFGLLLWAVFIVWFLQNRSPFAKSDWIVGRRLAYVACAFYFVVGLLGIGLFTSVPQSVLLFLCVGWLSALPAPDQRGVGAPTSSTRKRSTDVAQDVPLIA